MSSATHLGTVEKELTHLDLAISPIMHAQKPRRSPLRLRFLSCILEEISYAICITYFPTIPWEQWEKEMRTDAHRGVLQ